MQENKCPMFYIQSAFKMREQTSQSKPNCIWLETSSCFGEVIALLDGEDPDLIYFLNNMCNVTYFGTLMGDEGEVAYEHILNTLAEDAPLILVVDGAIPLKDNGLYTVMARYKGVEITALDAVRLIAPHANYILAVGTCASFGGPTAATPNLSQGMPLSKVIDYPVINIPGCPANPVWSLGTLGYILQFGMPVLDSEGRPHIFFSQTIHTNCPRRSYFDAQNFAAHFGDPQCLFKLGCRGPVTSTLCPINRWNQSDNWPIGANTTCIGCAHRGFPDQMEPFYTT